MPTMRLLATLLSSAVLSTASLVPAAAQEAPLDFFGRGPYRAEVPRPDSLLGYGPGARHTQYATQQAVLERLVAASDGRAAFEEIGVTEEGRHMRVLLISSPENLARRDAIRADLTRLADPRTTTVEEARTIAGRTPVVVFLSYSIHGNEPAGFEAAMWVAYQLLASNEPATRTILDSVLVVLNPSANPDGHERFAVWYNSIFPGKDGTDEPASLEWSEPWSIWGRYSHYRFDMNRDLIAQSQAPTRAMLGAIRRWHAQVVVDLHSTTEQYFFPPFAEPLNTNIPAASVRWVEVFGKGNAAAFDRYGWQYFTRDVFDGHYVGYFDASPMAAGATGMTYETDGGKALQRRRDDNTVITFREGIAHHYVASLATLETAAANRTPRLVDFQDFFRSAMTQARSAPMKRFVVLPDQDPTNAARMIRLLSGHGIEVRRLTAPYTASAAHSYFGGAPGRHTFAPGALIVDLDQPESHMARALLEPDAEVAEPFRSRELEKFARNQRRGGTGDERYDFYDVTAWALPFTLGLEAWWTEDLGAVTAEAVGADWRPTGGVSGRAQSAYVFPNDRQGAAALAMALLREGYVVNASAEPLRADGTTYPRGTFVVRVVRNPGSLHDQIGPLASTYGVPVTAIQSAFPDSGTTGVGSANVGPVFRPRVLVAANDGISQTSYGALWYFLERELGQPFVPVALGSIGRMSDLDDYNVLIIPEGSPAAIERDLGSGGTERLKAWVRDGGVLIAYGAAALFPSRKAVGLSSVKAFGAPDSADAKKQKADSLPAAADLTPPLPSPKADTSTVQDLPGTIFRAALDKSHWLTAGYDRSELAVMLAGDTFLAPSTSGANPVAFVSPASRLSGFAWPNTERLLTRTVWAAVDRQGRGNVVVFADDPLFRAFWRGTGRLLTNAMLFGTGR